MSNFILVIPEGWTQLDWEYISNNGLDAHSVENALVSSNMADIENPLKQLGLIAESAFVLDAKLFDNTYFMVRLG